MYNFCCSKDTIKEMKRQVIYDKGFIHNLLIRIQTIIILKWMKDEKLLYRRYMNDYNCLKTCLASLVFKEIQIIITIK